MTAWSGMALLVFVGTRGYCPYTTKREGSCGQGYHQARILTPAHTIVIVSEERQVREENIAGDSGDHIKHLPL